MKSIVINARRDAYSAKDIKVTMTVGQLIETLQQYDPKTPVMVGNDYHGGSLLWYTYGELSSQDVHELGYIGSDGIDDDD